MPKSAINPIPQGFHAVTAHLVCRDAASAIDFYKRAFGAEEMVRLAGPDGEIMHASFKIGDSIIMLAEEAPQWNSMSPVSLKGSPVTLHLYVKDSDAAFERAVKSGAKAKMPPADMFWGDRYGKVVDPFGHEWAIATHVRDMSHDEIQKAGAEAMKSMCSDTKSEPSRAKSA